MTLASLEFSFSSIRRALADGVTADLIIGEACCRAQACAGMAYSPRSFRKTTQ